LVSHRIPLSRQISLQGDSLCLSRGVSTDVRAVLVVSLLTASPANAAAFDHDRAAAI